MVAMLHSCVICIVQKESEGVGTTGSNLPAVPMAQGAVGLGLDGDMATKTIVVDVEAPDFVPVFSVNTMRMLLPIAKVNA